MKAKTTCLLLTLGALISGFAQDTKPVPAPSPTGDVTTQLFDLEARFQQSLQKEVQAVHQARIKDLNSKYAAAVGRSLAAASQAGNLDDAAALKAEQDRALAGQGPGPVDEPDLRPVLKPLRNIYRTALAGLDKESASLARPIYERYVATLGAFETQLTKATRIEEALTVRAKKEAAQARMGGGGRQPSGDSEIDLFNGKDLAGWAGMAPYWSVADGAIVGRSSRDTPNDGNTFLVWQGGQVSDFEFSCKYKLEANNPEGGANSGIQFRSVVTDSAKYGVAGYQAELDNGKVHVKSWPAMENINGCLTADGRDQRPGGGIYAAVGQKVVVNRTNIGPASVNVTGSLGGKQEFASLYKAKDWNEVKIIAQGNHIQIFINGKQTVDAIDESERYTSGLIGLQLQAPQLFKTVRFKDIRLRTLK